MKKSNGTCIFWNKGYCKFSEENCRYVHQEIAYCKFQEQCARNDCRFYHHAGSGKFPFLEKQTRNSSRWDYQNSPPIGQNMRVNSQYGHRNHGGPGLRDNRSSGYPHMTGQPLGHRNHHSGQGRHKVGDGGDLSPPTFS